MSDAEGEATEKKKARKRFLQHLPIWITSDPEYATVKSGARHFLEVVAGRCDKPDRWGNLLGCFGGRKLAKAAGCSNATFWRHVSELEGRGYIVTINRGGGRLADVYGIPGQRGHLDILKIEKREGANGRGGSIPTKYDRALVSQRLVSHFSTNVGRHPSQDETAPVSNRDTNEPSQFETLPSPYVIPLGHPPFPSDADDHEVSDEGVEKEAGTDPKATPAFDRFWRVYPSQRKKKRKKCLKLWIAAGLDAKADHVIRVLSEWKSSRKWTDDGGRYIDGAMSFIEDELWMKAPEAPVQAGPPNDLFHETELTDEDRALMPSKEEIENWEKAA